MSKIVIAGGGFAGVSALRTFIKKSPATFKKNNEIVLIDKKSCFEFLPMLPDTAGGWLKPDRISNSFDVFNKYNGVNFLRAEIQKIDLEGCVIKTADKEISYDYLIIAGGSKTNFYGNKELRNKCAYIDDVNDAVKLHEEIIERAVKGEKNVVVVGGGYTGIELAGNIDVLLKNRFLEHKIHILERSPELLTMVPEWMRGEVKEELEKMRIEVICDESVTEYDGNTVILGSGRKIEKALCVWSAGVKTADFLDNMDLKKERSRIVVDKYLRPVDPSLSNVFVAGDSAHFAHTRDGKPLRMAVMFSIAQGKTAAVNILKKIKGQKPAEYKPLDLGYIIPVASGKAPGKVLGFNVHGFIGYIMHYFMCIYRSENKKKFGILKDLFLKMVGSKKKGADNE